MAVATKTQEKSHEKPQNGARPALSSKARALMEELNADAAKSHIWVRTQMNSPAQRPWFTDTGGQRGAGQLANRRVAANQLQASPYRLRLKEDNRKPHRLSRL